MFSIHKNSYLHNYYKDVNPRLINRSVQRAIDFLSCNDRTLAQVNRLGSEKPGASKENVEARPGAFEENVTADLPGNEYGPFMSIGTQSEPAAEPDDLTRKTIDVAFQKVKREIPALIDEHDLEPPFNRLTSEQPNIPVQNVDVTRRPLGFGRVAMLKLRRELHHKHEEVIIAAIESICDLVHDPERGYEAINLKIVDRLVDLIAHENAAIREKTCKTLTVLAGLAAGKEAIVDKPFLLENIAICIEDSYPEVRIHVAAMLEMIARFWKAADELVDFGFVSILLANLLKELEEISKIHLETLASLMYGMKGKTIAMDADGFNIFVKYSIGELLELLERSDHDILSRTLECLALLTSTCVGEKMAKGVNLLNILQKYLFYENVDVHTNAAQVIMFSTVKTTGKIHASTLKGVTKKLVQLSRNRLTPRTQIFAIKALTNICEHPDIRKEVKRKYYDHVETIQVDGDPCIKAYKDILMTVIGWTSSSST